MSSERTRVPQVIELEVEYEFCDAFSEPPTHVPLTRATKTHPIMMLTAEAESSTSEPSKGSPPMPSEVAKQPA
jgi:hypothetical protein